MTDFLKNPFVKFILSYTILLVLWLSLYKYIYVIDGSGFENSNHVGIEKRLSILLGEHANFFSSLFGYNPVLEITKDLVIVRLTDFEFSHGTWIGEPCNGLKVMGLFALFIIAYPGKHKHKWWFILSGIIVIHFFNALRVSGLTIIEANWPQYLDFNHNVTFQVLIYSIIFLMWYLWVQKFSKFSNKKDNVSQ